MFSKKLKQRVKDLEASLESQKQKEKDLEARIESLENNNGKKLNGKYPAIRARFEKGLSISQDENSPERGHEAM